MTSPIRAALAATFVVLVFPAAAFAQQSAPPAPRNEAAPQAPYANQPYANQPYASQPYANQPYANAPYGYGQPSAQPYGNGAVPLQRDVARALPNGCRYVATVRGQFTPVGPMYGSDEPQVQPAITIGAQVTCANGWATNLSENVVSTAPIALPQLEDTLDRRGTVFVESYGQRCAYMPQFFVGPNGNIDLENVNVSCGRPGRGRQHARGYRTNAATQPQPQVTPQPAQRVR